MMPKRVKLASVAPWKLEGPLAYVEPPEYKVTAETEGVVVCRIFNIPGRGHLPNGEFIAYSRKDVPDLCAWVRELETKLEAAEHIVTEAYGVAHGDLGIPDEALEPLHEALNAYDFEEESR
ncbi:unnamed protein product [marine sediment metagenome]|uniref:Uncharacterized protein n=1 Tax=marine sediment metagenome TaxID=412755 RepID=X1PJ50_9ZZZZ